MGILNQVADSVKTYFDALAQFGYKKQGDIDKLLVYSFIEELLSSDMRAFITESDYRLIEKALSCLYGSSCLIPYPQYANTDTLFGHITNHFLNPRITEDNNIRHTEEGIVRFKASNYDK